MDLIGFVVIFFLLVRVVLWIVSCSGRITTTGKPFVDFLLVPAVKMTEVYLLLEATVIAVVIVLLIT